jgi:hypothetical protein
LLFRTGVFEAVYPWGYTLPQTGKRYIKEYPVLRSFYDEFSAYLGALSLLGMTPPLLLCMTYLNTAGMALYHPPQFETGSDRTLKMNMLHLPVIESNTMSFDPDEFLKKNVGHSRQRFRSGVLASLSRRKVVKLLDSLNFRI